ncbi:MAG: glycine cleavage T C-terminal barrel domain-containing protein, partial [Mucinivorans sp.]
DRGIARHGYSIADQSGNIIGSVTSGTQGPSLKKAIGMGYVATGHNKVGSEIFVIVRDKALRAQVVKMPFYKVQK